MPDTRTYPVSLIALGPIRPGQTRDGCRYVSFRARADAAGRSQERTVRAFGAIVTEVKRRLDGGRAVKARVAYDGFVAEDGTRTQTMRVVSLG